MNSIQTLSSILGLSFASGVNLYAAVLVIGLGSRYGFLTGMPGELHVLANPVVLVIAGAMYFLEFFADKIPFVSVVWDSVHTFIRPIGGAALALASASNLSPLAQILAMLAGGSIALGTHSTKLGYRLLAHASPEPVSNSVFSLAEDFGVVGLVVLVYKHPVAAVSVVAAMLVAIALIAPFLLRAMKFLARGFSARFASWFGGGGSECEKPVWLMRELGAPASGSWRVYQCFARTIPGVPRMKPGYLAVGPERTVFATKGLFGAKVLSVDHLELRRGLVYDCVSGRSGDRQATLYFTKDRASRFQPASAAAS